ncbi:hypothetical protein FQN53_003724, partial [Emmonsiellopsis sp. PD_33]
MPTELQELVEFLHHGNTQIRHLACENLVGFSESQPSLFKEHQLLPIRDLKLLVRDYEPIAKNALTMLINLSGDEEVLKELAEDDVFLETLLSKVTNKKEPHANEITMLLANLAKSDSIKRLVNLTRPIPKDVSTSPKALDQLMDCFIKGQDGGINKATDSNYDYLAYLFADISKFEEGRAYFMTKQDYDSVIPITKLTVFTEHRSHIRRKGVASTLKNVAFEINSHPQLLSEDDVNILPYILLPIAGPEEFPDEESAAMLPDLQLLPPDKERDSDVDILSTHLETLLLLTTTREGREKMREVKVYPLVRECHLHVNDENVQEGCDRLVQVLMRDEEGEGGAEEEAMGKAKAEIEAKGDEEDEIVEALNFDPLRQVYSVKNGFIEPEARTDVTHLSWRLDWSVMHYLPHFHLQQPTPPDLRPCIAELLRTGYHPSELVLRVERVIEVLLQGSTTATTSSASASTSAKRRSYRIFLSDGELVIQALLGKALHRFASTGEIVRGAVLGLERFEVRRGRRVVESGEGKGKAGEVVFLAVEGLRRLWGPVGEGDGVGDSGMGKVDDLEVGGDGRKRKRDDGDDEAIVKEAERKRNYRTPDDGSEVLSRDHEEENTIATQMIQYLSANLDDVFDSADEDVQGHEVHELLSQTDKHPPQQVHHPLPEPPLSTEEPSNAIQAQKSPAPPLNDYQPSSPQHPAIASKSTSSSSSQPPTPFHLPGNPLPISRPLNLHPLTTLLHPPHPLPKRNYLCDILAIITWISPQVIKRRHMPPKRDLRVIDASIAGHPRGGMSVSVFVDAEAFMPRVGTVGLFRGLKTHEWEGVSLNAYEKE